ncbi:hypothetical protein ACLOJK_026731 [Asimina triloba]
MNKFIRTKHWYLESSCTNFADSVLLASSPLKVKEDDEVDKLDIELDVTRKSRRVYRSVSPEGVTRLSLNAKTGMFSKRMKILHRDPKLFAQRVAAIKRAKRRPAARKRASEAMKTFFSDPENRRKRSLYMKGVTTDVHVQRYLQTKGMTSAVGCALKVGIIEGHALKGLMRMGIIEGHALKGLMRMGKVQD